MSRLILAVDPGVTTGWVLEKDGFQCPGETRGEVAFMAEAYTEMGRAPGQGTVVCEDFVPRPGALTWEPASLHLIGFLKGAAHLMGWAFKLQKVGDVKRWATDAKLRRAGWWVPGQDHARDALRHLMYYRAVTLGDVELQSKVAG